MGWIALVLPLAALQLRGRLRPHAVGLSGMAVLGLLACTIRGLQPCLALGHRPRLGLSHADARLGRLCVAGRGGHLVDRVVANRGRRRGTAARPDPHGRRLGPRGGHPGGHAGTESGILARRGTALGGCRHRGGQRRRGHDGRLATPRRMGLRRGAGRERGRLAGGLAFRTAPPTQLQRLLAATRASQRDRQRGRRRGVAGGKKTPVRTPRDDAGRKSPAGHAGSVAGGRQLRCWRSCRWPGSFTRPAGCRRG